MVFVSYIRRGFVFYGYMVIYTFLSYRLFFIGNMKGFFVDFSGLFKFYKDLRDEIF